MADIYYPCELPGVLVNSNAYSPNDRVQRNDLSGGPPVFVLQDSDGFVLFDVTWRFTGLQVQVFRNWFRSVTAGGSKLFDIDLYVDGPDGAGTQTKTHECYFDGPYQATQQGRLWLVSATLLAIEEQLLDECDGVSLVNAYGTFGDYLSQGIIDLDDVITTLEQLWAA